MAWPSAGGRGSGGGCVPRCVSSGLCYHVHDLSGLVLATHGGWLLARTDDGLVSDKGQASGDEGGTEGQHHGGSGTVRLKKRFEASESMKHASIIIYRVKHHGFCFDRTHPYGPYADRIEERADPPLHPLRRERDVLGSGRKKCLGFNGIDPGDFELHHSRKPPLGSTFRLSQHPHTDPLAVIVATRRCKSQQRRSHEFKATGCSDTHTGSFQLLGQSLFPASRPRLRDVLPTAFGIGTFLTGKKTDDSFPLVCLWWFMSKSSINPQLNTCSVPLSFSSPYPQP